MNRKNVRSLVCSVAILSMPAWAMAQAQAPIVNPEALVPQSRQISAPGASTGGILEAAPTTARTRARHADPGVQLEMRMHDSEIWNPQQQRFDKVKHRGYSVYVDPAGRPRGTPIPPAGGQMYMAPLINAKPGETVRIDIRNHLGAEPNCDHKPETMNDPDATKCYNNSNNHFHGGWVNPAGNSDNVLRTLFPSDTAVYEYEYNIPVEHPAGTFWYHPHVHGSTAIQVGSGMAGAIIVEGNRWPMIDAAGALRTGDIDVLLRRNGKSIPDRTLLLQQIQYACHGNADGDNNPWTCAEGETGEIRDYKDLNFPQLGSQWVNSQRFTTVNGRVSGMLPGTSRVGVPERWRFIHAGFSNPVGVQVLRRRAAPALVAGTPDVFEKTAAPDQDAVIARECLEAEAVPLFEIAADGLTRPKALQATQRILHPGYRSDLLVSFPAAGDYCVVDNQSQEALPPGSQPVFKKRLLFTVKVLPGASGALTNPRAAITSMMIEAAQAATASQMTLALRGKVLSDLRADLSLDAFAPHATLAQATLNNYQFVRFALAGAVQTDGSGAPAGPGIGHTRVPVPADPANPPAFGELRYSDNPTDVIKLYLGDVDEWHLTTKEPVGHPFHIHVNPFEVMAVMTRPTDGSAPVDLTLKPDSQYFGMKGVFKDTIFVEPNVEVIVRSHYERYIGKFVLHCHILYHEDVGMMRQVEILDPVRVVNGAVAASGHGVQH